MKLFLTVSTHSFPVHSCHVSITEAWAVYDQQPHLYFPAVFIWIHLVGLITRSYQGIQTDCTLALYQKKERRNLIKCSSLDLKGREYLTDAMKCRKNTTASELWSVFQLLPRVEKESYLLMYLFTDPFVLLVMAQLETQGRRGCTKGKVIISWPPILYHGKKPFTTSACSYRQTPWFSFQYGCQVF